MKQHLRLFLTMLLCAALGQAWSQDVTYDFTSSGWSVSNGTTLTNGTVSMTGSGTNFKMNSGYFYLGKNGAYLNLPLFDFAVDKIVIEGTSGASESVKQNIYVGDVAVSEETTGAKNVSNTYNIATGYQTARTQYTLKVTSNHNTQISFIKIYKKSASGPIDPVVTLTTTDIKVGETTSISTPLNLSASYESDAIGVATVSEEGVITGVSAGEANIKVTWVADNNYKAGSKIFTVTVTENTSTVFVKVTDASQLVADNEYIIVSPDKKVAMGAPNNNNNKIRDAVDVTIENNEVSIDEEGVAILTLGGNTDAWTFYASDTKNYLALNASSNEVHSAADVTDNAKWTITGNFELQSNTYSTRILQYNSGSPRFACYTSSQNPAVLFVKKGSQTNTKFNPELSFGATTSFTVFVGGDFIAPALINPHDLEGITYESSDDDIASVDPETGDVTIGTTEGEVTITASFAGNDDYNAGSASYTITVSKASQGLTVNNAPTSMLVGESIQLDWTSSSGNSVTITTSDATVIELDDEEEGLLHAVGAGTATIKVSQAETEAYKADEVSFTVTVTDPSSSKAFVKVTNLNQVVAGNKYILVTENGMAMGAQDGNFRNEVEVTLADDIAYVDDDVAVLTLGGKAGTWTFSDTEGELSFTSDESNYLVTKTDATDAEKTWRISNDFQVWHRAFPARTIQDNTSANHFGCFRNTQVPSYLYVEQGSDIDENYKKDPVLSIANAFLELGSGSKKPKVNTPSNGTITYSGFDDNIVTFTDGNMEAVAEGTTTVTATLEATAAYEGDVTTFTITVVPAHSNMASHLYKKVTSNDDLTAGKYLIVYEEGSKAFNGGLTTLDAAGNVIDVTINNNKIFCDEDAYFLIDPEAGTLRSASGYYIGVYENSNGLKQITDASILTNDFSIGDDGNAVIKASNFEGSNMTLLFNTGGRFRYYKAINNTNKAIQLYKAVDPFSFSIKEVAYDGVDHYATISALGSEAYYQVSGGAEVFTLTIDNHKLVFSAPFTDGDVIPSNGAYLVRGVPGDYEFTAAATPEEEVPLGENMLVSSGENGVTAEEMAAAHDNGYVFYKLTLHPRTGKAGFLWGAADGAAFDYTAGHQAYLAVPPTALTTQAVSGYFFDGTTTTGIEEITIPQAVNNGSVYTLSGVRVNGKDLPKGIYVVNGKKMVIK